MNIGIVQKRGNINSNLLKIRKDIILKHFIVFILSTNYCAVVIMAANERESSHIVSRIVN